MNWTEVDEITDGKTIEQLETEIQFQLSNGESAGGAIVSAIQEQLDKLKSKQ